MAKEPDDKKPTVWQLVKSILAAGLGVQSEEARQRDFARGSPAAFIVGGIVATVLFVVMIVVVVNVVISSAG